MKHIVLALSSLIRVSCCSLFLALALNALGEGKQAHQDSQQSQDQTQVFSPQKVPPVSRGPERLSQWMNSVLKDDQGRTVGHIADFIVNPISGRIQFAIVSLQDQEGKLTAVPWQLITAGNEPHTGKVNAGKEKLDNSMIFGADNYPDFAQPAIEKQTFSYYGVTPQGNHFAPGPRGVIPGPANQGNRPHPPPPAPPSGSAPPQPP